MPLPLITNISPAKERRLQLAKLAQGHTLSLSDDTASLDVTSIALDSRACQAGTLFVAVAGSAGHGADYLDAAIEAGAIAVLADKELKATIPVIVHKDAKQLAGVLASRLYQPQPQHILAVTGTNGKTSVVHFCRQLLAAAGKQAASIGTLGVIDHHGSVDDTGLTTPSSVALHRSLHGLANAGAEAVALEASSHGLHQGRLAGLQCDVAAFTNLTQDHLDYHQAMDAYAQAKQLLFTDHLAADGVAVLNADDAAFEAFQAVCKGKVISYGEDADISVSDITPTPEGLELKFNGKAVQLPLIGAFQAQNVACALGMLQGIGVDALAHVATLTSVPGRMEQVAPGVVVDYAHTPDALEKALSSLRAHCEGQLRVVFGAGGDRDTSKRAKMGAVAAELADIVIVTDDNPRTEDMAQIRRAILEGCSMASEVEGRKAGIAAGLEGMQQGDCLLVAGKGHEDYQIIGEEKHHFDDREVIKELL